MGGIDFTIKSKGASLQAAYSRAVDIATDTEGDNTYNGTISTTDGCRDVTSKYKASGMKLDEFIRKELETCGKRYCMGIELSKPVGNELKTKSQVENMATKGTKKWLLKYTVHKYDQKLNSFDTKGEAVAWARVYTEKYQVTTNIIMEKVLESGSNVVAMVTYKRSSKERDGEYVFFGIAAC